MRFGEGSTPRRPTRRTRLGDLADNDGRPRRPTKKTQLCDALWHTGLSLTTMAGLEDEIKVLYANHYALRVPTFVTPYARS